MFVKTIRSCYHIPSAINNPLSTMINDKQKSQKQTNRGSNPRTLAAKKNQVVEAARVHKFATRRGRTDAVVVNDENIDISGTSRPRRRSSRLNAISISTAEGSRTKNANAMSTIATRAVRTCSPTTTEEGAQSDTQSSLDEMQELRRQLREEKGLSS
jgi:hypothetical protein